MNLACPYRKLRLVFKRSSKSPGNNVTCLVFVRFPPVSADLDVADS